MTRDPYNVLFLCTGNPARSIMAECLIERWDAAAGETCPVWPGRPVTLTRKSEEIGRLRPDAAESLAS